MAKLNYFAYGSNMLTERLRARCPSAVRVGRAEVPDFRIEFSKRSVDRSGKATLVGSVERNCQCYGILFEIDQAEIRGLDRSEGAGRGYDVEDNFLVHLVEDGSVVGARTYLAAESEPYLEPYDWYLALIIAGALEHNLSSDYITTLYQTPYQTDSDHGRQSRGLAIEALRASGISDYMTLLRR